jgi:hypothetical protein
MKKATIILYIKGKPLGFCLKIIFSLLSPSVFSRLYHPFAVLIRLDLLSKHFSRSPSAALALPGHYCGFFTRYRYPMLI